MKKILKSLCVAVAAVILLGSCQAKQENTQKEVDTKIVEPETMPSIKLGFMPSLDSIPFVIAKEQGFDTARGIKIELENFKNPKDRDAAFQAGAVDGINTDLVAVFLAHESGVPLQVTSATFGQFDLISNQEKFEDLVGKEILIAKNQGPEFAAEKLLEKAGINADQVTFTDLPAVPARVEMVENNKAGAAILPEPLVSIAVSHGMHHLGSTRDIGLNPFVLAFSQETIEKNEKTIQTMYDVYNDAIEYMKTQDPKDYLALFIDTLNYPEELKDKITIPEYPKAEPVKMSDIEAVQEWCKAKGTLTKDVSASDILNTVYFK